ncbi:hypothetical protein ACFXTI_014727 [Malus domestica]
MVLIVGVVWTSISDAMCFLTILVGCCSTLLLFHHLYVLIRLLRFHHRSRSRVLSLALLPPNPLVQNGYVVALCRILSLPRFRFPLLFRTLGVRKRSRGGNSGSGVGQGRLRRGLGTPIALIPD